MITAGGAALKIAENGALKVVGQGAKVVAMNVVKSPGFWSKVGSSLAWAGSKALGVVGAVLTPMDSNEPNPVDWQKPNPLNLPLPENVPVPIPPKTPKKQDRLYEQYVLIAEEDGDFDIMVRGQKEPQGKVQLKKGDVWKYGTTVNPEKRYTQKWLREKKLRKVRQTKGTKAKVLNDENTKIIKYREVNGQLPPGNKQTN